MKLQTNTLIIGAGYSGLLTQKHLDKAGIVNFIVDKGADVQFSDNDYVIVMREKNEWTTDIPTDMHISRISSGVGEFYEEYSRKLYKKSSKISIAKDAQEKEQIYKLDNNKLLADSRVYGNIEIDTIDIEGHFATGKVTHFNKPVSIKYDRLIVTIPLYEFVKLVVPRFPVYMPFIQFYPIGIIRKFTNVYSPCIKMEYYSDPLVPFYRKHHSGNTVYYEYCINRPFDIRFNAIIGPGKFMKPNQDVLNALYKFLSSRDIYLSGRYATWDPDFNLDDINNGESKLISASFLMEVFR